MKSAMTTGIFLVVLVLCCSGCMSTVSRIQMCSPHDAGVYPGVRLSAQEIHRLAPTNPGDVVCLCSDFPFTAVCDTLWLPLDLAFHDSRKHDSDGSSSSTTPNKEKNVDNPERSAGLSAFQRTGVTEPRDCISVG